MLCTNKNPGYGDSRPYMPSTFPSPLLAHQGLVIPLVRRWPGHFDVIALFVGAAMPDLVDILAGFITGTFKQWYGHSLIGIVMADIPGGLLLTWLIAVCIAHLHKSGNEASPNTLQTWQSRWMLWGFSVTVGVLSHLAFDLISHETNLLLYPWHENVRWLPEWWYVVWFKIPLWPMFGSSYAVGPHSLVWCLLTIIGTFLFYQYTFHVIQTKKWRA
jgi:hypothetical protein